MNTETSSGFEKTLDGIPIRCLNNAVLRLSFEPENVDRNEVARAVSKLCDQPDTIRPVLAKAIYAMCLQSFEDCDCDFDTPQAQLDWEAENGSGFDDPKVPAGPEDIWQLVSFSWISVEKQNHDELDGQTLVKLLGSTAWDGEHGISLRFDADGRFIEAGDQNG